VIAATVQVLVTSDPNRRTKGRSVCSRRVDIVHVVVLSFLVILVLVIANMNFSCPIVN
jgi:hypothetical protein